MISNGGSSEMYALDTISFPGFCWSYEEIPEPLRRLHCKTSRESLPFPIPLLLYLWYNIRSQTGAAGLQTPVGPLVILAPQVLLSLPTMLYPVLQV